MKIGDSMLPTKLKQLLYKGTTNLTDYITLMLEISASSARFGVILENEGKFGTHICRANLNVMLITPFGTAKTNSIANIEGAVYAHNVSMPGLIGTVTREGQVLEGSVTKAGGKVLVIDEFQNIGLDTKDAMNSILENNHYTRDMGWMSKVAVNKMSRKNKFSGIRVPKNSGHMEIFSKFSCITAGMWVSFKSPTDMAFFSRFVPIHFNPSIDWIWEMMRGRKKIRINPSYVESDFIFRDWVNFVDEMKSRMESMPVIGHFNSCANERGYIPRLSQDIARIACFSASINRRKIIKESDWKMALNLMPNILASYLLGDRSDIDYEILMNHGAMNQQQLADKLGVTQAHISKRIAGLKAAGLFLAIRKVDLDGGEILVAKSD